MFGVYNIYVTMLHFDIDSFTVIFYHLTAYKSAYVYALLTNGLYILLKLIV